MAKSKIQIATEIAPQINQSALDALTEAIRNAINAGSSGKASVAFGGNQKLFDTLGVPSQVIDALKNKKMENALEILNRVSKVSNYNPNLESVQAMVPSAPTPTSTKTYYAKKGKFQSSGIFFQKPQKNEDEPKPIKTIMRDFEDKNGNKAQVFLYSKGVTQKQVNQAASGFLVHEIGQATKAGREIQREQTEHTYSISGEGQHSHKQQISAQEQINLAKAGRESTQNIKDGKMTPKLEPSYTTLKLPDEFYEVEKKYNASEHEKQDIEAWAEQRREEYIREYGKEPPESPRSEPITMVSPQELKQARKVSVRGVSSNKNNSGVQVEIPQKPSDENKAIPEKNLNALGKYRRTIQKIAELKQGGAGEDSEEIKELEALLKILEETPQVQEEKARTEKITTLRESIAQKKRENPPTKKSNLDAINAEIQKVETSLTAQKPEDLTEAGYIVLKKRLQEIESQIDNTTEKKTKAAAHGDLSENAEYKASTEELEKLLTERQKIQEILDKAKVYNLPSEEEKTVKGGSAVTYSYNDKKGKPISERIMIGNINEDLAFDETVGSLKGVVSPALLGKKTGEKVTVNIPGSTTTASADEESIGETIEITIEKIEVPTPKDSTTTSDVPESLRSEIEAKKQGTSLDFVDMQANQRKLMALKLMRANEERNNGLPVTYTTDDLKRDFESMGLKPVDAAVRASHVQKRMEESVGNDQEENARPSIFEIGAPVETQADFISEVIRETPDQYLYTKKTNETEARNNRRDFNIDAVLGMDTFGTFMTSDNKTIGAGDNVKVFDTQIGKDLEGNDLNGASFHKLGEIYTDASRTAERAEEEGKDQLAKAARDLMRRILESVSRAVENTIEPNIKQGEGFYEETLKNPNPVEHIMKRISGSGSYVNALERDLSDLGYNEYTPLDRWGRPMPSEFDYDENTDDRKEREKQYEREDAYEQFKHAEAIQQKVETGKSTIGQIGVSDETKKAFTEDFLKMFETDPNKAKEVLDTTFSQLRDLQWDLDILGQSKAGVAVVEQDETGNLLNSDGEYTTEAAIEQENQRESPVDIPNLPKEYLELLRELSKLDLRFEPIYKKALEYGDSIGDLRTEGETRTQAAYRLSNFLTYGEAVDTEAQKIANNEQIPLSVARERIFRQDEEKFGKEHEEDYQKSKQAKEYVSKMDKGSTREEESVRIRNEEIARRKAEEAQHKGLYKGFGEDLGVSADFGTRQVDALYENAKKIAGYAIAVDKAVEEMVSKGMTEEDARQKIFTETAGPMRQDYKDSMEARRVFEEAGGVNNLNKAVKAVFAKVPADEKSSLGKIFAQAQGSGFFNEVEETSREYGPDSQNNTLVNKETTTAFMEALKVMFEQMSGLALERQEKYSRGLRPFGEGKDTTEGQKEEQVQSVTSKDRDKKFFFDTETTGTDKTGKDFVTQFGYFYKDEKGQDVNAAKFVSYDVSDQDSDAMKTYKQDAWKKFGIDEKTDTVDGKIQASGLEKIIKYMKDANNVGTDVANAWESVDLSKFQGNMIGISEIFEMISKMQLSGKELAGHNIKDFDVPLLQKIAEQAGISTDLSPEKIADENDTYRMFKGSLGNISGLNRLSNLSDILELPIDGSSHFADFDAKTSYDIYGREGEVLERSKKGREAFFGGDENVKNNILALLKKYEDEIKEEEIKANKEENPEDALRRIETKRQGIEILRASLEKGKNGSYEIDTRGGKSFLTNESVNESVFKSLQNKSRDAETYGKLFLHRALTEVDTSAPFAPPVEPVETPKPFTEETTTSKKRGRKKKTTETTTENAEAMISTPVGEHISSMGEAIKAEENKLKISKKLTDQLNAETKAFKELNEQVEKHSDMIKNATSGEGNIHGAMSSGEQASIGNSSTLVSTPLKKVPRVQGAKSIEGIDIVDKDTEKGNHDFFYLDKDGNKKKVDITATGVAKYAASDGSEPTERQRINREGAKAFEAAMATKTPETFISTEKQQILRQDGRTIAIGNESFDTFKHDYRSTLLGNLGHKFTELAYDTPDSEGFAATSTDTFEGETKAEWAAAVTKTMDSLSLLGYTKEEIDKAIEGIITAAQKQGEYLKAAGLETAGINEKAFGLRVTGENGEETYLSATPDQVYKRKKQNGSYENVLVDNKYQTNPVGNEAKQVEKSTQLEVNRIALEAAGYQIAESMILASDPEGNGVKVIPFEQTENEKTANLITAANYPNQYEKPETYNLARTEATTTYEADKTGISSEEKTKREREYLGLLEEEDRILEDIEKLQKRINSGKYTDEGNEVLQDHIEAKKRELGEIQSKQGEIYDGASVSDQERLAGIAVANIKERQQKKIYSAFEEQEGSLLKKKGAEGLASAYLDDYHRILGKEEAISQLKKDGAQEDDYSIQKLKEENTILWEQLEIRKKIAAENQVSDEFRRAVNDPTLMQLSKERINPAKQARAFHQKTENEAIKDLQEYDFKMRKIREELEYAKARSRNTNISTDEKMGIYRYMENLKSAKTQHESNAVEFDENENSITSYNTDADGKRTAVFKTVLTDQKQINNLIAKRKLDEQEMLAIEQKMSMETFQQKGFFAQLGLGFKQSLRNLTDYSLAYTIIGKVKQGIQQVIQVTKQLDASLVNLRIATGATEDETKDLLSTYTVMAKEMGRTTEELATASNDWLRAGYEGQEAADLTKASMYLSTLGMIDSAQATRYLISTMKGWKIEASEVMGVVDKLTAVDLEAAISAGDLAETMSRANVSASLAGSSMDNFIGYVTTVADVTQKETQSIGESFKTLYARWGNVKLGKWEYTGNEGESEEEYESLNDIQTALDSVGIKYRDVSGEMKNFDDVLEEVGNKWGEYSKTTQNALAGAFAGVRQRENFVSLMENWENVGKFSQIAAKAQGTATTKMLAYNESLEASQKRLIATVEEFATKIKSSDFLKWINKKLLSSVETFLKLWKQIVITIGLIKMPALFSLFGKGAIKTYDAFTGFFGKDGTAKGMYGAWKGKFGKSAEEVTSFDTERVSYFKALKESALALTEHARATKEDTQATNQKTGAEERNTGTTEENTAAKKDEEIASGVAAATEGEESAQNVVAAETEKGESAQNVVAAATEGEESAQNVVAAETEKGESAQNIVAAETEGVESSQNTKGGFWSQARTQGSTSNKAINGGLMMIGSLGGMVGGSMAGQAIGGDSGSLFGSLAGSGASLIGGVIGNAIAPGIGMGIGSALGGALSMGIGIALKKTVGAAKEAAKATREEIQKTSAELQQSLSTSAEIKNKDFEDRFTELTQGVDEKGRNKNLDSEDYKEYRSMVDTLTSAYPELIKGIDSEGNALIERNSILQDSIKLLEEEIALEKQKLYSGDQLFQQIQDKFDEIWGEGKDEAKSFQTQKEEKIEEKTTLENQKKKVDKQLLLLRTEYDTMDFSPSIKELFTGEEEKLRKYYTDFNKDDGSYQFNWDKFLKDFETGEISYDQVIGARGVKFKNGSPTTLDYGNEDVEKYSAGVTIGAEIIEKENYQKTIEEIDNLNFEIQNLDRSIAKAKQSFKSLLQGYVSTLEDYQNAPKEVQDFVNNMMNKVEIPNFSDADSMKKWTEDLFQGLEDVYARLISISEKTGDMSFISDAQILIDEEATSKEIEEAKQRIYNQIYAAFGDATPLAVKIALGIIVTDADGNPVAVEGGSIGADGNRMTPKGTRKKDKKGNEKKAEKKNGVYIDPETGEEVSVEAGTMDIEGFITYGEDTPILDDQGNPQKGTPVEKTQKVPETAEVDVTGNGAQTVGVVRANGEIVGYTTETEEQQGGAYGDFYRKQADGSYVNEGENTNAVPAETTELKPEYKYGIAGDVIASSYGKEKNEEGTISSDEIRGNYGKEGSNSQIYANTLSQLTDGQIAKFDLLPNEEKNSKKVKGYLESNDAKGLGAYVDARFPTEKQTTLQKLNSTQAETYQSNIQNIAKIKKTAADDGRKVLNAEEIGQMRDMIPTGEMTPEEENAIFFNEDGSQKTVKESTEALQESLTNIILTSKTASGETKEFVKQQLKAIGALNVDKYEKAADGISDLGTAYADGTVETKDFKEAGTQLGDALPKFDPNTQSLEEYMSTLNPEQISSFQEELEGLIPTVDGSIESWETLGENQNEVSKEITALIPSFSKMDEAQKTNIYNSLAAAKSGDIAAVAMMGFFAAASGGNLDEEALNTILEKLGAIIEFSGVTAGGGGDTTRDALDIIQAEKELIDKETAQQEVYHQKIKVVFDTDIEEGRDHDYRWAVDTYMAAMDDYYGNRMSILLRERGELENVVGSYGKQGKTKEKLQAQNDLQELDKEILGLDNEQAQDYMEIAEAYYEVEESQLKRISSERDKNYDKMFDALELQKQLIKVQMASADTLQEQMELQQKMNELVQKEVVLRRQIYEAIKAENEAYFDYIEADKENAYSPFQKSFTKEYAERRSALVDQKTRLQEAIEAYENAPEEEKGPKKEYYENIAEMEKVEMQMDNIDDDILESRGETLKALTEMFKSAGPLGTPAALVTTGAQMINQGGLILGADSMKERAERVTEFNNMISDAVSMAQEMLSNISSVLQEIAGIVTDILEAIVSYVRAQVEVSTHLLDIKKNQLSSDNETTRARQDLLKELKSNQTSAQYLTIEEREKVFNEGDYSSLLSEISTIEGNIDTLGKAYSDEMKKLGPLNTFRGQIYKEQYDRMIAIQQKSLDIAKANLEVNKKMLALENAVNERDVKMLVDGEWKMVADFEKVRDAREAYLEAQANAENLSKERLDMVVLEGNIGLEDLTGLDGTVLGIMNTFKSGMDGLAGNLKDYTGEDDYVTESSIAAMKVLAGQLDATIEMINKVLDITIKFLIIASSLMSMAAAPMKVLSLALPFLGFAAEGTPNFKGGLVVTDELGPEIKRPPIGHLEAWQYGTQIIPHHVSENLLKWGGMDPDTVNSQPTIESKLINQNQTQSISISNVNLPNVSNGEDFIEELNAYLRGNVPLRN